MTRHFINFSDLFQPLTVLRLIIQQGQCESPVRGTILVVMTTGALDSFRDVHLTQKQRSRGSTYKYHNTDIIRVVWSPTQLSSSPCHGSHRGQGTQDADSGGRLPTGAKAKN